MPESFFRWGAKCALFLFCAACIGLAALMAVAPASAQSPQAPGTPEAPELRILSHECLNGRVVSLRVQVPYQGVLQIDLDHSVLCKGRGEA